MTDRQLSQNAVIAAIEGAVTCNGVGERQIERIFADEAIAAVTALPDAWRPIEEAPKDGTPVLLAASHGVSVGWWEINEPTFKWRFVDDFDLTPTGCCEHENDDRVPCNGMTADAPTHFMPLPSPPEANDGQ